MPSTPKKTLAIIDDDTELLDELTRALGVQLPRSPPASATRAPCGRCSDDPPSAIVLDLDLVTFDPFELLRLIAGDPALRGTPVLVLSSASDFATFEHAHRVGAAEFVTKPFSPDDLRRQAGRAGQRPQTAHRRPPQAGRPARRQRPRHAGAARRRPRRASTTTAGASARCSSPRASSASRTSSRRSPARCTSAWSTSRRPRRSRPPSGCCRATSSCAAGSCRSASTTTAASCWR